MEMYKALLKLVLLASAVGMPALTVAQSADIENSKATDPVRMGIARLEHGHINGFFSRYQEREGVELVGIYEPDTALASRYAKRYNLPDSLFYTDLQRMIRERRPGGVAIYSNTFDHKSLVETIAATGTDIMLEKPLAVNMEHARAMKQAVEHNEVQLVVNYETSWYPSNHVIYEKVVKQKKIGEVRKMVHHAGHRGPEEIGVTDPFLSWLMDPKLNGGGALMDFGCYGANLMTWVMDGQMPISVTAVTRQLKDDSTYSEVDDEATIILDYPHAQGIVQASWNWPYSRKDMEVYGTGGQIIAPNSRTLETRYGNQSPETKQVSLADDRYGNPISYFRDVIKGEIEPYGLSSLENNMIVTSILDAARKSADTGQTIQLKKSD